MSQDYKLSLGRIVRALWSDNLDFFHQTPDWEIYDEGVTLSRVHCNQGETKLQACFGDYKAIGMHSWSDGWTPCCIHRSLKSITAFTPSVSGMAGFWPHLLESAISLSSFSWQVPPRIRELIAETLKPNRNLISDG